jgi:hypothetical protein
MLIFNYLWTLWFNILPIFLIFFIYLIILLNHLLINLWNRNDVILMHNIFFLNFLRFHHIFYNSSLAFNLIIHFSTLIKIFIDLILINLQFVRIKRNLKYLLSINRLNHIQIINWTLANNNRLYHLVLIEILLMNKYWLIFIEINWILSII